MGAEHDSRQKMLSNMTEWDMVPISDIVSYSKITDLLTRHDHQYRLQGSSETTLEQLRESPVVLIGALDNPWVLRLTDNLRFHFERYSQLSGKILDREQPSRQFAFDNMQPIRSNERDYAIVASYYDRTIEQHVVIAAGIGKNGTQSAAEFLTSNKEMQAWLTDSKLDQHKNIELIVSTEILDGQPGPPHVVASTTW